MKKTLTIIFFLLFSASAFYLAMRGDKHEVTDNATARKEWESTPAGVDYKNWQTSEAGKKVYASEAAIRENIRNFTEMKGIITSLTLPAGSRLGYGVMIKINGEDFILSFGPMKPGSKELMALQGLKVNDIINIKSHSVSHAPKYTYPIVAGDYIERNSQIIYKREPRAGGCLEKISAYLFPAINQISIFNCDRKQNVHLWFNGIN